MKQAIVLLATIATLASCKLDAEADAPVLSFVYGEGYKRGLLEAIKRRQGGSPITEDGLSEEQSWRDYKVVSGRQDEGGKKGKKPTWAARANVPPNAPLPIPRKPDYPMPKSSEQSYDLRKLTSKPRDNSNDAGKGVPVVVVTKIVKVVKEVGPVEVVTVVSPKKDEGNGKNDEKKKGAREVKTATSDSMKERIRRLRQHTDRMIRRQQLLKAQQVDAHKRTLKKDGVMEEEEDYEMLSTLDHSGGDRDVWVPFGARKPRAATEDSEEDGWKQRWGRKFSRGLDDPVVRFFVALCMSAMACAALYGLGSLLVALRARKPRDDDSASGEGLLPYSRLPVRSNSASAMMLGRGATDYGYAPLPGNYQL